MDKLAFLFLSILAAGSMASAAVKTDFLPIASKVEFEAIGRPSMMKVKGTGEGPTGKISLEKNQLTGSLNIKLSALKTGIELRDEHMKDKYLHVKDHPEAILTLNPISIPENWTPGTAIAEKSFTGKLKLHGVENPVSGLFSVTGDQTVTAKFEFKLTDFKIDIPSYLGVTIADLVKVKTEFKTKVQ